MTKDMPDDIKKLLCDHTVQDEAAITRFIGLAEMCGYRFTRDDTATPPLSQDRVMAYNALTNNNVLHMCGSVNPSQSQKDLLWQIMNEHMNAILDALKFARAKNLSKERKTEIARSGAKARWDKKDNI